MGEFGVSDKEDKKNSSTGVYGLGLKVQNVEAVPSKTMMMMVPSHHNHHIPQLAPFDNDPFSAAADADGPIPMTYHTNHFVNGASASASGAALVRPLQPFHTPASSSGATTYPAFKSSAGGIMAASLGFPFTNAQWKELERQAMIYKYLMSSVPVPPHLLIPTAASLSPLDSGFNLRFSSGSDAEPGRCRRTDGKKWRCSRDVAPNHKYCERHMHRGRPRSRKPVELQPKTNNDNQLIKRIRHDYPCFPAPAITMAASNPIISKEGSSSQFLASSSTTTTTSQRYFESSLSLDNKFGVKAAQFDSLASVSSNKEPRGLEWMLKGDPICMAASDPEWQPLIQSKLGLNTGITCNNNASVSTSNYKDPLQHMNSYEVFSCGPEHEHHNNRSPLCPNPQSVKPRGFIDAWCNAETEENSSIEKNSAASNPKLSLSSLDLSMGGVLDEDMGSIHMGLGLMEPPAPWAASSTPGGPLAEVLMPTTTTSNNETASHPSHPSSPSGVLQKTLASLSDSSSSSSPRVSSSRANSAMAFLCFNHTNLPSSS